MFKAVNIANEQILNADKWEDVGYSYEARPPYTWKKDIEDFDIIEEYCECVNMSYRAEEKVKKLHKEWSIREKSQLETDEAKNVEHDKCNYKYVIGDCFVNSFGNLIKIFDITTDNEVPYKVKRYQGEVIDIVHVGEKYLDEIERI
jgi:hypothetical protein